MATPRYAHSRARSAEIPEIFSSFREAQHDALYKSRVVVKSLTRRRGYLILIFIR